MSLASGSNRSCVACGRRVWAPRGQRPLVTIHPRSRWRYLLGYVHPASGRTQWHLGSGITVELDSRSLAAFAQQAGAGPTKELVVVVDQAGWHMSPRLHRRTWMRLPCRCYLGLQLFFQAARSSGLADLAGRGRGAWGVQSSRRR